METTHRSKESICLQISCLGIGFIEEAMSIGCDKSSSFFLESNLVYLSKTKHIDIQYHFVRDMVEENKYYWRRIIP